MGGLLNFLTGLSILLIIVVLASLRRSHIRAEYSVSWLGAGLAVLLLSRSPALMGRLGKLLGINMAPLALLIFVGCLFLFVVFRLSVIISKLKDSNIALAQRVAILEFRLNSVDEETQTHP